MPAHTRRLIAAALVAVGCSALLGGGHGNAQTFLPSLGLLVFLGGWLARQMKRSTAETETILALLLIIPAVGTRLWGQLIAEIDLPRLTPTQAAWVIPTLIAGSLAGVSGHLAGAGAALLVLRRALLAAVFFLGAIVLAVSQYSFSTCAQLLISGSWASAARHYQLGTWMPVLLVPLLVLRRSPRRAFGLWVVFCGALFSAAIVPAPLFWEAFSGPEDASVPQSTPGLPVTGAPIYAGRSWADQLDRAGYRSFPRGVERRWCSPTVGWSTNPRAHTRALIPPETTLEALMPLFQEAHLRELSALSLEGAAPPLPGSLGALLARPAATMLLDTPPEDTPIVNLTPDGTRTWSGAPSGTCVLHASAQVSVGVLYDTVRALGDPGGECEQAVGLNIRFALPPCL